MEHRLPREVWLTAAECARRIGLSVRALRLYERHGLVTPQRTEKQWRLYGTAEIARLNEVLTLKALGLSLSSIAGLLKGYPTDLARVLALQREALSETRARAENGLAMIDAVQATIAAVGTVSIDDLMNLVRETSMTDSSKDAIAWRRYEQNRPRTEIEIAPALYDDYAGYFQLENGPFYVVSHRDGRLFTRVIGQSDIEIVPEAVDHFFMKALPVQVTFVRDPAGKVANLIHHQNGEDTSGTPVDPATVKHAEEALNKRVLGKVGVPGSEAIIRRIIDEHLSGKPDFDAMTPPLAALAREQFEIIQADLKRGGPLKTLSFKGVSQAGWDVYDVNFENAAMEWGFILAEDGKISGLYLRPSP